MQRCRVWISCTHAKLHPPVTLMQAVKPARRCASVRACGPVLAVIVPEPRLHAALEKHSEVIAFAFCFTPLMRVVASQLEACSMLLVGLPESVFLSRHLAAHADATVYLGDATARCIAGLQKPVKPPCLPRNRTSVITSAACPVSRPPFAQTLTEHAHAYAFTLPYSSGIVTNHHGSSG